MSLQSTPLPTRVPQVSCAVVRDLQHFAIEFAAFISDAFCVPAHAFVPFSLTGDLVPEVVALQVVQVAHGRQMS